jgi:hypothetical protein
MWYTIKVSMKKTQNKIYKKILVGIYFLTGILYIFSGKNFKVDVAKADVAAVPDAFSSPDPGPVSGGSTGTGGCDPTPTPCSPSDSGPSDN